VSSEQARDLRQQGIAAAKAGQKDQARQFLQQSIRLEPTSEAAWMWLASVARDQRERLFCLRKIIELNPANEQALKALRQVEETLATSTSTGDLPVVKSPATEAPPKPSTGILRRISQTSGDIPAVPAPLPTVSTQEMLSQTPGVPYPDPIQVRKAAEDAEVAVRQALEPPVSGVRWVTKTKGRAGERDVWVLRGYIAAAALAATVVLCIASFAVVSNTPALARVVFAPTATLTLTPTNTASPTPGLTPTPSPTPRVTPQPTATIALAVPTADIYFPEATALYPAVLEAPLRGAISLIDRGAYALALPTLSAERANTVTRFNASPYYYEAIAQARSGDIPAALRTLREAEGRLEEAPNDNFKPLLDVGFAYVLLLQAAEISNSENQVRYRQLLSEAQERAEAAVAGDPRLVMGHVLLARSLALQGDEAAALEALDVGFDVTDLQYDTNLIAERAAIYLQQGEYALAEREAFYALYVDPSTVLAHQVQIEAALRQNRPGLAVLRAQEYLFYYPGSVEAWTLLGDARTAEGNFDLALAAYSQALEGETNTPAAVNALIARGSVYLAQGQAEAAVEDFTQAFDESEREDVRLLRMEAAYRAGRFATALEDADALENSSASAVAAYIRGLTLVEQAEADGEAAGQAAVTALLAARTGADAERLAVIDEYLARAYFLNDDFADALESIDGALGQAETAMRYYVRGLILQARGQREQAASAFDWVVTWSSVYPFPFAVDAAERLEELR
jgi:tetratricopeptide (TPR) repeat protein